MKKARLGIFLAGIFVIITAIFGYKININHQPEQIAEVNAEIVINNISPPKDKNLKAIAAIKPQAPKSKPSILKYRNHYIDPAALKPAACLRFSHNLDPAKQPQYADYIKVSPNISLAVKADKRALCLSGFDFGQDYEVSLKAGLPGKDVEPLANDESIAVSFGARPPYVGFAGNGIILPRKDAQGLTFETVNVNTLKVDIYKVNDRMLARREPTEGLLTAEGEYSWEYQNAASRVRSEVWTGDVDIKSAPNQRVTTTLNIEAAVGALEDGAYVVSIARHTDGKTNVRPARAWRWIIVTDLALTNYQGGHGLTVFARSLKTAKRQAGTEIHLIANNNAILGKAVSDESGKVSFPPPLLAGTGADKPRMLLAYGPKGDFAMIDLHRSPLDLSDYNITGRQKLSPIDGYGFADRGIYRPGETSHLTFMLRSANIHAAEGRPSTLSITRPDNIAAYKTRIKPSDYKVGTFYTAYDIPSEAPRGTWQASLLLDGQDEAVTIDFDVQDFVPQKLRVGLRADKEIYNGREELRIALQSDFLYGAPAAGLLADGEARLEIDPNPFPAFKGYSFAPHDPDFTGSLHYLNGGATDETGAIDLVLEALADITQSNFPLRLEITGGAAEPSGRYVRDSLFIPARAQKYYAGIKSNYNTHRIPRQEPAQFEIVLVDKAGLQTGGELEWTLMEQDWDYQWYKENGRWRYRRDLREQPLDNGVLSLEGNGPAIWERALPRGDYRLALKDEDREINSYEFAVGWGQKNKSDKPDALQLTAPNDGIKPGARFTLSVTSPYDGEADLILTNGEVFISRPIQLSEGQSEIDLTYDASWGVGIYALISLYTPRDAETLPIPRRAVGTAYLRRDTAPTTLQLSFKNEAKIKPRQRFNVVINALQNGRVPKGPVWVNLAAVDEGILQITKYKSPAAETFFHAKTALMTSIYDDYGRILNPNLGTAVIARSGGDGIGGEGLTVIPQKTIALFKGYVKMENGSAVIPLDIPDYNGELRLMASAWSETAVGSASMALTLRDPVPVELALPRFLAPGDRIDAVVSANNLNGAEGAYGFKVNSADGLALESQNLSFDLPRNIRSDQSLSLEAKSLGVADINYEFSGPGGYNISGSAELQTRSPFLPISQAEQWVITPGESLTLPPEFVVGLIPGSIDVTLSVTNGRLIDPSPYIAALRRYPYGCTEQTVSAALPLLYARDFGADIQPSLRNYDRKMQNAINKLALRQSENGSFGLWREGDGLASLWLGVYASDFILRADDAGYDVDADVLKRTRLALKVLNQLESSQKLDYRANVNHYNAQSNLQMRKVDAASYAGYVMARDGQGRLGQARYIFDSFKSRIKSPLSFGFLSETFTLLGDDERAQAAYELAIKTLGYVDENNYYQTPLRDLAAIIGVISNESRRDDLEARLVNDIEMPNRLRTQELGQIILALRAQSGGDRGIKYRASGAVFSEQKADGVLSHASAYILGRDIANGVTISNQGEDRIVIRALASGAPASVPPPVNEGLTLTKSLHDLKGEEMATEGVRRGERYVVKLNFASKQNRSRTIVLADMLPAGFEIEQILEPADGKQDNAADGAFSWAGEISAFDMSEARDDRFIASGDTQRKDSYTAAYIVRAVSNGSFTFPGAVVEDMYRPGERAISETKSLVISSGGTL